MGSLKDQLRKANLISKKKAKQLAHEQRVKRKKLGKDGLEAEQQKLEEQRKLERQKERQRAREREAAQRREREEREARARLHDLVKNAYISKCGGPRRFFFVTRDRKLPFLEVSDDMGRKLESGRCGIVEAPLGLASEFAIVPRDVAEKVWAIDRKAVLFLNGQGGAGSGAG